MPSRSSLPPSRVEESRAIHDSERDPVFSDWLAGHKAIPFKVVHAYAFEHADRMELAKRWRRSSPHAPEVPLGAEKDRPVGQGRRGQQALAEVVRGERLVRLAGLDHLRHTLLAHEVDAASRMDG